MILFLNVAISRKKIFLLFVFIIALNVCLDPKVINTIIDNEQEFNFLIIYNSLLDTLSRVLIGFVLGACIAPFPLIRQKRESLQELMVNKGLSISFMILLLSTVLNFVKLLWKIV
jgi:hypothetical protein